LKRWERFAVMDQNKNEQQLIAELAELRHRIAELEKASQEKDTEAALLLQAAPLGIHECDTNGRTTFVNSSQKRAEVRLHNSERTLRTLMDASPESILLIDTDETILFANATMARRFGTTADKIVGRTSYDLVSPELAAKRMERLQEVVRTGKAIRFEDERSERCFEIAMHPIFGEQGEVAAVAVLAIDQTERKRSEEALKQARDKLERRVEERTAELVTANELLRQSEEKYRGLLEACPDAVVMIDLNGTIRFASRQTYHLVGLSDSEELVGRSVFDYVIEDDRRRLAENIPRLAEAGIRRDIEYTALRQDGAFVPTEISSAMSRDAKGQPIAVMAVIRDITDRKQAHDALQREHRTLRHLLQSSDHERQLIAYEIHDGLAQHLAGAIMQFQTYSHQKESNPKLATKTYEAGMTMLQQGHFESRRLIAGVRPPILDESGVVAAVGHLVHEQGRLGGPKIDFHSRVDFDRLAPTVENSIYRIAQEGLTNACQYSKSEKVRVSLVQRDDWVHIDIRDWGIGFDPKVVQENRFGLVGIRQRARLLGGKCSIRSKTGKGTRITVELPVVVRE
jgi:two-component system, NarL family, sensor histidine kinase UhpB